MNCPIYGWAHCWHQVLAWFWVVIAQQNQVLVADLDLGSNRLTRKRVVFKDQLFQPLIEYMGIDFGRRDIGMA